MAEKLPYFPLYVDAFDTDDRVIPMTYEAEGIYNALLRFQWRHRTVPDDLRSALPKAASPEALEQVRPCFTVLKGSQPSRSFNPKLEEIRERVSRRRKLQSEGGREGGIKSGLSRRSQAKANLEGKLKPTRSIASSSSSKAVEGSSSQGTEEQQKSSTAKGKWLAPYFDAWVNAYQGEPSPKELARFIAPLRNKHGDPAVVAAWETYLAQTEAEYAAPARFSKTYGKWAGTAAPVGKLSAKQREEQASLDWVEQREKEKSDGE